jgi:hypothetical protein
MSDEWYPVFVKLSLLHPVLRECNRNKDYSPYDPKAWPIISEQVINTALGTEYQGLQDLPPDFAYSANIFARYITQHPSLIQRRVPVGEDKYLPYLFVRYPLNYALRDTQAIKPTPTISDQEHNVWMTYFGGQEGRMAVNKAKAVAAVAQPQAVRQDSALKTDKSKTSGKDESVSADAAYIQAMKLLDKKMDTLHADKEKLKQTTAKLTKERKRAMNTMIKVAMLDAKLEEQTKRTDTAEAKIAELNGTLKANIAERDAVFKVSRRILQEYRDQESRMKDQSALVTDLWKQVETLRKHEIISREETVALKKKLQHRNEELKAVQQVSKEKDNQLSMVQKQVEDNNKELERANQNAAKYKQDAAKYRQQVVDIYNKMNKSSPPGTSTPTPFPTKRKFKHDPETSDKGSTAKQVKLSNY